MSRITNQKDFYSGLLFIAFGAAALILARNYPLGTAARMGPGYFPYILGGLLIFLGAILCIVGLKSVGPPIAKFYWRPLAIVLLSIFVFGLSVQKLGLVFAVIVMIFIAGLASHEFNWKESLIAGVLLSVFTVLVFIKGLGVQFPIWPLFLTGGN